MDFLNMNLPVAITRARDMIRAGAMRSRATESSQLTQSDIDAIARQAAIDAVVAHRASKPSATTTAPSAPDVPQTAPAPKNAVLLGYSSAQLAELAKGNPERYAAIRACAQATTNPRYSLVAANLKRSAVRAVGKTYDAFGDKDTRRATVEAALTAVTSGRGIIDKTAHEQARACMAQLRDIGVDMSLFAPGFGLPGLQ